MNIDVQISLHPVDRVSGGGPGPGHLLEAVLCPAGEGDLQAAAQPADAGQLAAVLREHGLLHLCNYAHNDTSSSSSTGGRFSRRACIRAWASTTPISKAFC